MGGLLEFVGLFGTEEQCIEHLATLRWAGGYVCPKCDGREAWRLKARPRVYECGVGNVGNGVSSDTDGSAEMVPGGLFDGPGQARRLGEVS